MSASSITKDIHAVGILNPAMRIFDVVMKTEYGTSYNSYIVKGAEKTALIETCHLTFFDQYLDNIRQVCDPAQIHYIILNHCEPDHSGVLARLNCIMSQSTNSGQSSRIFISEKHYQSAIFTHYCGERRRSSGFRRKNAAIHLRSVFTLARFHAYLVSGRKSAFFL